MMDWKETTWGKLATLEYGKALRDYKEASGPYRVYGTNGAIGWHTEPLYSQSSVIIGRKGAYRGVHFSNEPFYVIDTAFYLKPKIDLDIKWAYYQLLTQDINGMDSGSAIPSTSRDSFYQLPVLLPPIKEQKRIAGILGSLDDKIELNRKQNETLEGMARAVFQSWFVDFDPVIDNALAAGHPIPAELAEKAARRKHHKTKPPLPQSIQSLFPDRFVDSPLGSIPKGWKLKSLFDTATFVNGSSFRSNDFCKPSEGLPIIKIVELKNGISNQTNFTHETLDNKYLINTGDMFYSWSGSPDTSLDVFLWTGGPGWLNQHIFKVVTNNEAEKVFEYFLLRHLRNTLVEIARDKQTTGLGHVTISDMKRLHIMYPNESFLKLYHQICGSNYNFIFNNLLENRNLTQLRDSLLPKLLTGEIEV